MSFTTNASSPISVAPTGPEDRTRPPALVLLVFRAAVGASLAFYFFAVFCIVRAVLGGFGFTTGLVLNCIAATFVMGAFIVWLAPLLELPEIWFRHRLPSARLARGECPECGYRRVAGVERCAECGSTGAPPAAWQFGRRTLRLFVVVTTVAFALGCGAAMLWIAADERAFESEARYVGGLYRRDRAWPMQFAPLVATAEGKLTAPMIAIEGEIDPNWRPRGARVGPN